MTGCCGRDDIGSLADVPVPIISVDVSLWR